MSPPFLRSMVWLMSVAAAYFVAASLGSMFIFQPEKIAAFWPAAGLSLGLLLVTPRRNWSIVLAGVTVGSVLSDRLFGIPWDEAIVFAMINAATPLVGACLMQLARDRSATLAASSESPYRLRRVRDVLDLFLISGGFVCAVSALAVTSFLMLKDPSTSFVHVWRVWWLGDALGIVTFTPLVLTTNEMLDRRRWSMPRSRVIDGVVTLSILTGLAWSMFATRWLEGFAIFRIPFVITPVLLWCAVRLGLGGSSVGVAVVSMIAVWGVSRDMGPLSNFPQVGRERTQVVQGFLAAVGLTTFILATAIREQQNTARELLELNEELQRRITERGIAVEELSDSERRFRAIFNTMTQFMGLLSRDGVVLEANRAALDASGAIREDVIGKPFWETPWWSHSEALQARVRDAIDRARRGEVVRFEATHPLPSGAILWVDFSLTPCFDESGQVVLLVPEGHDITERRQAEATRAQLAAIVEGADDAILSCDLDGVILSWNPGAERMFGYAASEAIGQSLMLLSPPELSIAEARNIERIRHGNSVPRRETVRQRRDGTRFPVDIIVSPVRSPSGEIIGASTIIRDITERKAAEDTLRRRQEELRLALDNVGQGFWWWDIENDKVEVDDAWLTLFGFQRGEIVPGIPFWESRIHPDDKERVRNELHRHMESSETPYDLEYRGLRKDGTWTWLNTRGRVHERDAFGRALRMMGTEHDISRRKHAELALAASEALAREFITHAPAAIAMLDRDLRYMMTSERWVTDYRLDGQPLIGRSHYEVFPNLPDRWREIHQRVILGSIERCAEDPFPGVDGNTEWLQWEARPWFQADGEIGGLIFFTQLITERKRAEELLRASLAEKEVLLREVHHRVKNNLAVIVSLFHLQTATTRDSQAIALLREAQDRVRSMALVHEFLYNSSSLAAVNFGEYAVALSRQIIASYQLPGHKAHLDLDIHPVSLTIEQSIPCGLILNELLSNCLKHGLSGVAEGRITLSLLEAEGTAIVRVADNGRGVPADFHTTTSASLGVRLIRILTKQLGGEVEYASAHPGTAVTVRFPVGEDLKTPDRGQQ